MIPVFLIDKISKKLSKRNQQFRLNQLRSLVRSLNPRKNIRPTLQGDLIYTRVDDDSLKIDTSFLPESKMWVWDLALVNDGEMLKELFPNDWYEELSDYEYIRNEDIYSEHHGELWAEGLLYENRKHLLFRIKRLGEQTFYHLLEVTKNKEDTFMIANLNLHFTYNNNSSKGFPIFKAVYADEDMLSQKSQSKPLRSQYLALDGGDLVFDLIKIENYEGSGVNYDNGNIDMDEFVEGHLGVRLEKTSALDHLIYFKEAYVDFIEEEPDVGGLPVEPIDFMFWEIPSGKVIKINSQENHNLKEVLDRLVKLGLYSVRRK